MKKQGQTQQKISSHPRVVWEQNDKFLSSEEQNVVKREVLKRYTQKRVCMVADALVNNDFPALENGKKISESSVATASETKDDVHQVISVEDQLGHFNHFDLPFGCQQPTAAHAHILGTLIKTAYLPETSLDTVVSFIRHLYHQYSAHVQPVLFRLSEAHALPFYEAWFKKYTWLAEYDRESWWDISKRLSEEGYEEDALLAHYQAMPTNTEFQKILKDLCNFESTSDGRWLASSTATAAQKVERPGLGVYGAQINQRTTKTQLPDKVWLQINNRNSVVNKTKSVERFICTLLMVYRATSAPDVLKHLQTLPQNLYLGNPDFDIVDPDRMNEVLKYHKKMGQEQTTIVWDGIDLPLASPEIQELWLVLAMATLGGKSAVAFGDSVDKTLKSKLNWYETSTSSLIHNYWVCFSSLLEVKFLSAHLFGKDVVHCSNELVKLFENDSHI